MNLYRVGPVQGPTLCRAFDPGRPCTGPCDHLGRVQNLYRAVLLLLRRDRMYRSCVPAKKNRTKPADSFVCGLCMLALKAVKPLCDNFAQALLV